MHDVLAVQIFHALQDLIRKIPNVFLAHVLLPTLMVFNQLVKVSFLCKLHNNVKTFVFEEGREVLDDVWVLEFSQNLDLPDRATLVLRFHMFQTDALQHVALVVSQRAHLEDRAI